MRLYKALPALLSILLLITFTGCDKDEADPNFPVMRLTPDNVTGKSEQVIQATLTINAPNGAKDITIYKTVNLVRDAAFGGNGTMTVTPTAVSGNEYQYVFEYQLLPEEVDKLVGINFRFEDNQGNAVEKDLTVNTVASGRQIIFDRRWNLVSKIWTSVSPPIDDLKECEKDDVYHWRADSTYTVNFGSSACTFDGFNVFEEWSLSEDEKTMTMVYSSLFDPSNITRDVYTVRSLTRDRLVLEQLVDLSVFGPPYTDKEVFVYTFEPLP